LKPDVIHVFNPNRLGGLMLQWLHSQAVPVVHDISDTALIAEYERDIWFQIRNSKPERLLKRAAKSVALKATALMLPLEPKSLDLKNSYFRSEFLRNKLRLAMPLPTIARSSIMVCRLMVSIETHNDLEATELCFQDACVRKKGLIY
jgi:hypothetical protein